jgi:hypothetical protein
MPGLDKAARQSYIRSLARHGSATAPRALGSRIKCDFRPAGTDFVDGESAWTTRTPGRQTGAPFPFLSRLVFSAARRFLVAAVRLAPAHGLTSALPCPRQNIPPLPDGAGAAAAPCSIPPIPPQVRHRCSKAPPRLPSEDAEFAPFPPLRPHPLTPPARQAPAATTPLALAACALPPAAAAGASAPPAAASGGGGVVGSCGGGGAGVGPAGTGAEGSTPAAADAPPQHRRFVALSAPVQIWAAPGASRSQRAEHVPRAAFASARHGWRVVCRAAQMWAASRASRSLRAEHVPAPLARRVRSRPPRLAWGLRRAAQIRTASGSSSLQRAEHVPVPLAQSVGPCSPRRPYVGSTRRVAIAASRARPRAARAPR